MEHSHSGHRQRLRDRYEQSGAGAFADHELLELLLTYAIPRRDVNEIAHALLERFGSLEGVLSAELSALTSVPGIGESTAMFLRLQHDVQRRMTLRRFSGRDGRVRLNTPAASARFVNELLLAEPNETALLLCLNTQRTLISTRQIAMGTLDQAAVHPRLVAEQALLQHAHSVLLAHNHPSGSPLPSESDLAITERVRAALKSLDIALFDHLIVGRNAVYSCLAETVIVLHAEEFETIPPEVYREEYLSPIKKPLLAVVMEQYQE